MEKRITLYVDDETLRKLKALASKEDRALGWVIRRELQKAMGVKKK